MQNIHRRCAVAIDMGGTNIKYGVVSNEFELLSSGAVPAESGDSKEILLDRLADIIKKQKVLIEKLGYNFCGVAVSTPGPFDYAAAKSGMKGKYDAIFGIDLRSEMRTRANLKFDTPILFIQDAAAFLMGELIAGSAKNEKNCSCVTLGTGVGYACVINGKMLLNEKGGPYYVLAFQKYGEELVENLVSGRAIKKRYGIDGKLLYENALNGDSNAVSYFYDIGKIIGTALSEIPETKKIDTLIIGGQVAFSFHFLEKGINDGLGELGEKIDIKRAKYPADAALFGVAHKLFKEK